MFKYFENLRRKPEPERRRAVIWISTGVTVAIFLVWAISLGLRMKAGDFSFSNSSASSTAPNISDTFSAFWAKVSDSVSPSTTTPPR